MSKKLISLVLFVLALGLVLTSVAGAADPTLVGWWKFEEASGTLFDQSDNHNDGTSFQGVLYQQPGRVGYAIGFDGIDDYVVVGAAGRPTDTFSFGGWFKTSATHEIDPEVTSGYGGVNNQRYAFDPQHGGDLNAGAGLSIGTNGIAVYEHGSDYMPATAVYPTELGDDWNHIMVVYNNKQPTIYLNGSAVRTGFSSPRAIVSAPIQFGGMAYGYFEGLMDEVRIYNRALSPTEIKKIAGRVEAYRPTPVDAATHPDTWVSLGWAEGAYASSHDVYLGDNFDDVNDGAESTFRGNQTSTMFIIGFPGMPYPDGLVPGTTYYWRVDEVNDTEPNSPWKGKVWSFSIPPRIAYEPNPADGIKFVNPDVELNWTEGLGAKLHHVYFGDNFEDVNNAIVGLPQSATTYNPGTLDLGKTYYWRIDEFDGAATYKGDVWSFSTLPIVPISDPDLIGRWKLDEGYGANTVDWSGYGNHGAIYNNTGGGLGEGGSAWVNDPERGIVLSFNGDNNSSTYVSAGEIPAMSLTNGFTWAYWTKQHQDQGTEIPGQGNDVILGNRFGGTASPLQFIKFTPGRFEYYNTDHNGTIDYEDVPADIWVHHAVVKDGANLTYYRNGEVAGTGITTATIDKNPFYMGGDANGERWQGYISDVRLYNKALTVDEVKLAMRGDPLVAWGPNPRPGSTPYIRDATPLNWSAGDMASGHDVYFGTDKDAVDNADASDTTGIYRGRQGITIYTPLEVEWGGGPYYWRIDEYNTDATISKGNIWSFTVIDFIEIDGIEDYNDYPPDEIFSTWIDGWEVPTNGSLAGHPDPPFAETGNVHGGRQSMPVYYENNFKYSEITMTLVSARDWTEEGVGALSLWFCGDAANAAERMYVNLNGIATVYHNNPDAALIDAWTEWTIDLQEFAAQGVNLANVNTISIGFGDKNNLRAGGSGMVLFDDIRLYRPAPELEPQP